MVDFAKLRGKGSTEKLMKALENQGSKFKRDERYWSPTVDKAGNGFAVIRFLAAPAVDGDDAVPAVTLWAHSFRGPTGKWYIENSLTSLDQNDPVVEYNSRLWELGKGNKETRECKQASAQKRKLVYISNILVVSDPAHPENNGKVFLFSYGVKIMDKIKDKLGMDVKRDEGTYVDPDEVKFDAFHFWEGADFKLKIRKVGDFRNYDKSEFATPSPLFGGDESKIRALWESEHSLLAEVAPNKFKSYDELKGKLYAVLGLSGDAPARVQTAESTRVADDDVAEAAAVATTPTTSTEDEDDYAAFAKLADER